MKKELIVALANSIVKEMLEMWFTNIKKRVGISNYLVVALDDNIEKFCKSNDVPVYCRDHDDGIERCDATGHREQSRMVRFSDEGSRRGLCGFAARAGPVGSRQSLPPRLASLPNISCIDCTCLTLLWKCYLLVIVQCGEFTMRNLFCLLYF